MSILAPADLPDNDAEILVVLARVRLWPAPASVQNRRGRCHARGRRNFLFEQTAKRPNS